MKTAILTIAVAAIAALAWAGPANAGRVPHPPVLSCKTGGAPLTQRGMASWYGGELDGRRTASGEAFDKNALTAAHPSLPMNALVQVVDLKTGKDVIVRVNDRGPYAPGRIIDVSARAAAILGMKADGVAQVAVRPCLEYVMP